MLSYLSDSPFTGCLGDMAALHEMMSYMPYNRLTLSAMRCVSKPFRKALQSPQSPWATHEEMIVSRHGQYVVFNAHENAEGHSEFGLLSISPIDAKFRNVSAAALSRYGSLIADGLTRLTLHYAQVDNEFFAPLGALPHLRVLELVSCRQLTSLSGASQIPHLEELRVMLCPLTEDGVAGLRLPRLRVLQLRSCYRVSNLNSIPAETIRALREVRVENCELYDCTTDQFTRQLSGELRVLHLSDTHIDNALTTIPTSVLENMEELLLSNTPVRESTLALLTPFLAAHCAYVALDNCREVNNYDALEHLHALRFLDVSGRTVLTGIESIESCPKLEMFRMVDGLLVDLAFLAGKQCLRVLDAASSSLTNESILALTDLPALDTVIFTDCSELTDVNVLHTCPHIRRVFCKKTSVDDTGVSLLVQCQELEELDLQSTRVEKIDFLVDCKALQTLNVCDTMVMPDGMQALLERQDLNVIYTSCEDTALC